MDDKERRRRSAEIDEGERERMNAILHLAIRRKLGLPADYCRNPKREKHHEQEIYDPR